MDKGGRNERMVFHLEHALAPAKSAAVLSSTCASLGLAKCRRFRGFLMEYHPLISGYSCDMFCDGR